MNGRKAFALAFALLIATVFLRHTYYNGRDFEVFHTAAQAVLYHQSPYLPGRGEGWEFKYAPYLLPFFLPFGLIPFQWARLAWGIVQILCLLAIVKKLFNWGIPVRWLMGVFAISYFVFSYHAICGQFTLLTLALGLWLIPVLREKLESPKGGGIVSGTLLFTFFSAKIFSLVSLVSIFPNLHRKTLKNFTITASVVLCVELGLTGVILSFVNETSFVDLFKDWMVSASSSESLEFLRVIPLCWRNQGFPALLVRAFTLDPLRITQALGIASVGLSLVAIPLWWKASSKLRFEQSLAGWLALGVILHPLAWFHSFVMVYPLFCFALYGAFQQPKILPRVLAGVGLILTTIITHQSVGKLGMFFEMASIKSWGTLLGLIALTKID